MVVLLVLVVVMVTVVAVAAAAAAAALGRGGRAVKTRGDTTNSTENYRRKGRNDGEKLWGYGYPQGWWGRSIARLESVDLTVSKGNLDMSPVEPNGTSSYFCLRRLAPFANVIAGDYFELESIPDIFCSMYVTLTTWKEICGSRASKRLGGTTLCPCVRVSIDDDRLAVVVVEMTTRLVARPEDDDDDDEVHERARDSAVGYHCH
ncbi:hypothetical protein G5I_06757 [Acromyrmex echinatior]|uniref:Discoidin domain-containing receptor 2 n=1 Tax=Acromyrmex echinatior TaxID=103372 RepID=F4WLX5_ACREC|nr:hypothetical protein G5I_06757 [Acromyrmex echinatior]